MNTMASRITSLTIVYSAVYSGADQRKHPSSASLAFVWGIHRWPVNSPHKWPVTRKMLPFDDVIKFTKTISMFIKIFSLKKSHRKSNKFSAVLQVSVNQQNLCFIVIFKILALALPYCFLLKIVATNQPNLKIFTTIFKIYTSMLPSMVECYIFSVVHHVSTN